MSETSPYFIQMWRDFRRILVRWKEQPDRLPLIIRGARQVGKTYTIESFGQEEFRNLISINFEFSPRYVQCFQTFDPQEIVSQLELIAQQKISPGHTLLFLDEIQQCPRALQSLRYFKEKLPKLHVIAAGSLLEFSIKEENFSFPVGRVQFAKLYPLTFEEFLEASGDSLLRQSLKSFDLAHPPPPAIHEHLLQKVKEYFIVGGMPAAVAAYLKHHSYLEAKYLQRSLKDAFESDFGKYAKQTQHRYLKRLFEEGPKLIGSHVKYNRIDPELPNPAREMKHAIELMKLAGLLHPVYPSSGGSLPLAANINTSVFKLIFLDIGLIQQALNIDPLDAGLMTGPLAEQFVGQELLAYADPLLDMQLFFWTREKTNSSAEVDYIIAHQKMIYPIEVKAGKSGKLRSLYIFLKEKKAPFGLKISQGALAREREILSVPLYLIGHLSRLIGSVDLES